MVANENKNLVPLLFLSAIVGLALGRWGSFLLQVHNAEL